MSRAFCRKRPDFSPLLVLLGDFNFLIMRGEKIGKMYIEDIAILCYNFHLRAEGPTYYKECPKREGVLL
jgi:hypothetical protein